ncbi:MAG: peptide ABC transporter substrate-binding protein [Fibrobacterota bacterium]
MIRMFIFSGFFILLFSGLAWVNFFSEEQADLTFILNSEPQTFDPALATGSISIRLINQVFQGLTRYDPRNLNPLPGCARSWTVSDNGKKYIFLMDTCRWSDGALVTAEDFEYSWRRALDPSTGADYAYQLYCIKNAEEFNAGKIKDFSKVGVKAVGDSVLEVSLENPTPYFLMLTSFVTLFPVPRKSVSEHGDLWTRPENIVSNGPYKITEHHFLRKIRLRRNNYFRKGTGNLQTVDALIVENINTCFNIYETGGADIIFDIPVSVIPFVKDRKDCHIAPYLGVYFYRFNVTKPPFDDVRLRKAFCMAVDRAAITENITGAGEKPAHSLVPPGLEGYNGVKGYKKNIDEARRLLDEYIKDNGDPGEIELLYNTSENHKKISEAVAGMVSKNLGIKVVPVNQEWKVYLDTQKKLEYRISRSAWIGDYPDPNTFIDMFVSGGGNNRTGWEDPVYDSLVESASVLPEGDERMDIFKKAEEILIKRDAVIMPLYFYVIKNMYRDRIKGVHSNLINYFYLDNVSIE